MTTNLEPLGYFWYDGGIKRRPYYSQKEIKRGKQKGMVWVEYLHCDETGIHLKRMKVRKSDLCPAY